MLLLERHWYIHVLFRFVNFYCSICRWIPGWLLKSCEMSCENLHGSKISSYVQFHICAIHIKICHPHSSCLSSLSAGFIVARPFRKLSIENHGKALKEPCRIKNVCVGERCLVQKYKAVMYKGILPPQRQIYTSPVCLLKCLNCNWIPGWMLKSLRYMLNISIDTRIYFLTFCCRGGGKKSP